ncbi:hypothetical protein WJX72_003336 [[Myrmecia] bisecta]|uniref:Uncharacterized protein n=1 Tax=[Myrmecia] bisecta TaxID=41462 RepID=A0AAW1Q0V4_9CHLO
MQTPAAAKLTGRVEFELLRVDKAPRVGGQHMVQLLIEVKDGDISAASTQESLVAQTVVQLLAAATQNDEDTWAALTNFHFWRFFQACKQSDGTWEVRGSAARQLVDTEFMAGPQTQSCLSLLFASIFPDEQMPEAHDLDAALQKVDDQLQQRSVVAANYFRVLKRAQRAEAERQRAEAAEQRVKDLEAQLATFKQ